jgi:Carboxypeptidase regulatory-like domain
MRHGLIDRERPNLKPPAARTRCLLGLLLLLLAGLASLPQSLAQSARVVQGMVQTTNDQPQPNAVVYLQDQKSLEVKTYITEADGHYRFGQLNSDADYQLWAEYKGHKSKTRSISSFDSRKEFNFDLKIDTSK